MLSVREIMRTDVVTVAVDGGDFDRTTFLPYWRCGRSSEAWERPTPTRGRASS
jgi:hypothetical protein